MAANKDVNRNSVNTTLKKLLTAMMTPKVTKTMENE
jgi:hypothetical protein